MRESKNQKDVSLTTFDYMDTEYYLQDELGSPIRLINKEGRQTEAYGYDEFGQDLYGNQGQIQPFGYTGYQSDQLAGTYFAQAREYQAALGRFVGRDIIKGFVEAPYTLNEYGYCWGNPLRYKDIDGRTPYIVEYDFDNESKKENFLFNKEWGRYTYIKRIHRNIWVYEYN